MRQFGALLLLFLWPVLSSHATLELAGCIHVHCDDHHSGEPHPCPEPPHSAAEDDYLARAFLCLPDLVTEVGSGPPSTPLPRLHPPIPFHPLDGPLSILLKVRHGPAPPLVDPRLTVPSWLQIQRVVPTPRAP